MKRSFAKKMAMLQIMLLTMAAILLVVGLGVKGKMREEAVIKPALAASPAPGEAGEAPVAGGAEAIVLDRDENAPVAENDAVTEVTPEIACDYQQWVGRKLDEKAVKETGRPYRILPPGSMVTMDYNAARINVEIDDQGLVIRVACG